ncbi:hypothetical protein D3C81_489840 [compost metagenome]
MSPPVMDAVLALTPSMSYLARNHTSPSALPLPAEISTLAAESTSRAISPPAMAVMLPAATVAPLASVYETIWMSIGLAASPDWAPTMLPMDLPASSFSSLVMILASLETLSMLPLALVRKVRPSVFFRTPLMRMVCPESTSRMPASLDLKLMPIALSALTVLVTVNRPDLGASCLQRVRQVPPSSN